MPGNTELRLHVCVCVCWSNVKTSTGTSVDWRGVWFGDHKAIFISFIYLFLSDLIFKTTWFNFLRNQGKGHSVLWKKNVIPLCKSTFLITF